MVAPIRFAALFVLLRSSSGIGRKAEGIRRQAASGSAIYQRLPLFAVDLDSTVWLG
jgi:hypothetical protein